MVYKEGGVSLMGRYCHYRLKRCGDLLQDICNPSAHRKLISSLANVSPRPEKRKALIQASEDSKSMGARGRRNETFYSRWQDLRNQQFRSMTDPSMF